MQMLEKNNLLYLVRGKDGKNKNEQHLNDLWHMHDVSSQNRNRDREREKAY